MLLFCHWVSSCTWNVTYLLRGAIKHHKSSAEPQSFADETLETILSVLTDRNETMSDELRESNKPDPQAEANYAEFTRDFFASMNFLAH